GEKPEVRTVVRPLGCGTAVQAGTHTVVEVVVDVRTGQVNHLPVSAVARSGHEIPRVHLRDHQRTRAPLDPRVVVAPPGSPLQLIDAGIRRSYVSRRLADRPRGPARAETA